MILADILKDSNYKLTQFTQPQIEYFEKTISTKEDKRGIHIPYITCLVRKKEIKLTPEEAVRQLYLLKLNNEFQYPYERMELEYAVSFGREKKRADIVIFDKNQTTTPFIMVELKKPKLKDGKEQLHSYCNASGAPIGIWSNGESISYYHRKDPNYFEDIPSIPRADQKLSDILGERWTIDDLVSKDKLVTQRKSLKDLILEMEDEVLANAGVDVFEELFKLVFTKLFDEMQSGKNKTRHLEFRNYGDTETELKTKIQNLFDKAKQKWEGVFTDDSKLMLTPSHLSVCVSSLQDVKLFNSNLDVVDEAFEYLINKSSKGEKGQYFTPRYVIDMCVKMLNPKVEETIIDTAAGSCGFPVHTIFHVWEQILKKKGLDKSHLFTLEEKPQECKDYVNDKVFAIDFDEKAVRVARTLNLIAGDGQTNVLHLNTLDYDRWEEKTGNVQKEIAGDEDWIDTYNEGWKKLKKLRTDKNSNRDFEFDILMANPPFAGDIKESRILAKYELGKKDNGKYQTSVGRDILFIERNLDFLKSGGRMAVVLPQGRFNNSSDKQIREFIAEHCRILAVVGLHGNVFKPHTGTKTSVLLVQKWDDKLCPKVDDYPIFFATMQEPSKDNSGEKIFVRKKDFPKSAIREEEVSMASEIVDHYDEVPKDLDEYLLDTHGHLIVKHDLFNHDGLTKEGIAEAFAEFGKREVKFFSLSPFNEAKYKTLLEGLEITIYKKSDIFIDNVEFRIDSEYYRKEYLELYKKIANSPMLDDLVYMSDLSTNGSFATVAAIKHDNNPKVIPFIRSGNVGNTFINESDLEFISKEAHENLPKSTTHLHDIMMARKGKIGGASIIMPEDVNFNCNENVIKLDIKDKKIINPFYFTAYFNSKYGLKQIERLSTGNVQPWVSIFQIRKLMLSIKSDSFQNEIQRVIEKAYAANLKSKDTYTQAETILLQEIGVQNFIPSAEPVNIKSFKESFGSTKRLDAEYYQKKYEDYLNLIYKYQNGFEKLSTACELKDNNFTPKENTNYKYVELSNIGKSGEVNGCTESLGIDLPSRARRLVNTGDVVISSIEGSLQSCGVIQNEYNNSLCSTGFYVIKSEVINSETLLVLFKSEPMQAIMKQNCSGTILTGMNKEEFSKIPIPIINLKKQQQIADLVKESFNLKSQSEHLLQVAKQAVEMAIEQNEEEAIKFINENAK